MIHGGALIERGPATVIGSVLEDDPALALERVQALPRGCGLAELRADLLSADGLRSVVARAGRPLVVTVRREQDGGRFGGSELERLNRIETALAAGAAFVDVERGSPVAEAVLRERAGRAILSHHGTACRVDELLPTYRAMAATAAARLKLVPAASAPAEAAAVRDLLALARRDGGRLACFASGRAGRLTRILAISWGSWATYGAAVPGRETAEGQLTAEELLELYRALEIGESTRRFALVGRAVAASASPAMHHAAYRETGLDACYLPLEIDRLEEADPWLGPHGIAGIEALGVTRPFKERAAARATPRDDVARAAGAINTVRIAAGGWEGYNTDGPAARRLLERHGGLRGARVAVVGAGGTAAAAAVACLAAGARVVLYNRTLERARALAARIGGTAEGLEALAGARWDVLVQATPLGGGGERVLPASSLVGRVVLDAVYGPRPTPLILDARGRGVATVEGLELLAEQARLQFGRMTGRNVSAGTLLAAGRRWLDGRPPAT